MKILFVASHKEHLPDYVVPFIKEQAEALKSLGVEIDYFTIKGRGLKGYLKQLKPLRHKIRMCHPDIVHAHYGLSGLLANLQRGVPVVTTYHGSDINEPGVRPFSRLAMWLSAYNIFVSKRLIEIARPRKNFSLLPCGVNLDDLQYVEKGEARKRMGLQADGKYVLFAGSFDNKVKNAKLAQNAIALLPDVELLELKGYSRGEVANLFYAVDTFLMTSFTEGSPQVVKEAMACGCPIVSVDVGDVRDVIGGTDGCYVAERLEKDIADKITSALAFKGLTKGKGRIFELGLDSKSIAKELLGIYNKIVNNL